MNPSIGREVLIAAGITAAIVIGVWLSLDSPGGGGFVARKKEVKEPDYDYPSAAAARSGFDYAAQSKLQDAMVDEVTELARDCFSQEGVPVQRVEVTMSVSVEYSVVDVEYASVMFDDYSNYDAVRQRVLDCIKEDAEALSTYLDVPEVSYHSVEIKMF